MLLPALALLPAPATAQNCDGTVTWTGIVPDCLSPEDKYRILFLTSTNVPQSVFSDTIGNYNDWVQNLAASSTAGLAGISSSFKVLGSTETTNARVNTDTEASDQTTDGDVKIFYFMGNKVADSYADLYDGEWDTGTALIADEQGMLKSPTAGVLTGSTSAGESHPLNPLRRRGRVHIGHPNVPTSELDFGSNININGVSSDRMYALSGVQTVAATAPTAAPSDLTATPGDAQVTVTWTALPDTANGGSPVTGYNVRYRMLTAPPSGDWTDAAHDGTAATAVITGLVNDTAYEAQVQAVNAEGEGPWSPSVQGTPMATTTAARVNEVIVPELARALVSSTLHALTNRIEQAREGGHAMQARLSGHSSLLEFTAANEKAMQEGDLRWREMLNDTSFTLTPSPSANLSAASDDHSSHLTFWGRGDYRSLSGDAGVDWDGDLTGLHVGADARFGDNLLGGVALSWTDSSLDYTYTQGGTRTEGTHESNMTSVHPYVSWLLTPDSHLWATVGYGRGEVEIGDDVTETSDSNQTTLAVGGGGRVLERESESSGAPMTLDVKAEAWWSQFELEGNDSGIEKSKMEVNRVRVAFELSREHRLADGAQLTPSAELGIRHDGGDGETGFGAELGGGVRYADASGRIQAQGRGRILLAHEGAVEEWGLSGTMSVKPGTDGLGLSLDVGLSWGDAGSGVDRLWDDGLATPRLDGEDDEPAMKPRLDAEIGYGLRLRSNVVTPYGGLALDSGNSRAYHVGARFTVNPASRLRVEAKRRERSGDDPEHRILLRGEIDL